MSCTTKVDTLRKDSIYLVSDGHSYPIARRKQDTTLKYEHAVFKKGIIVEAVRIQRKPEEPTSKVEGSNTKLGVKQCVKLTPSTFDKNVCS